MRCITLSRWLVHRRTLREVRHIRKEADVSFKKLAWRFGRFGVYAVLTGLAAKFQGVIDPTVAAAAIGGILAALDKVLGVGALVKP